MYNISCSLLFFYSLSFFFFFFNDTATTEIYTLSLHDALPILCPRKHVRTRPCVHPADPLRHRAWIRLPTDVGKCRTPPSPPWLEVPRWPYQNRTMHP